MRTNSHCTVTRVLAIFRLEWTDRPGYLFIRVVFHDSESIAFGIITVLNISHTGYRNYRRENPAASFGNPLRTIIYRFNFDGVDSRVPLIVPGT